MRARYGRRHGLEPPTGLVRGAIELGGHTRTYWLAAQPPALPDRQSAAPLLIVLHGAGGQGSGMASLTGLDRRGPAAGFVTVFPDGVSRVWNDSRGAARLRRREGVDDVAFMRALVARLESEGRARGRGVYLTGISNGGLMSEHLARHGLLPVAGIGLVAGPGTETSRAASLRPLQAATVVVFAGTADPLIPYAGGPIGFGRRVQRRRVGAGRVGAGRVGADRGVAVAAELVASDWAAANGIQRAPTFEQLSAPPGDLPVTRITWTSDGKPPVVLYRIDGGGHTWPGGGQYLPVRFIGPSARNLDATGILLEQFRANERAIPEALHP